MYGDRPRVTPQEWREHVRPVLSNEGFNEHRLDQLEALFQQSFQINPARPDWKPGIDAVTLAQTMKYLHEHKESVPFSDEQLQKVDSVLTTYIAKRT